MLPIARAEWRTDTVFHCIQSLLLAGLWVALWVFVSQYALRFLDVLVPIGEDWLFIAVWEILLAAPIWSLIFWPLGVVRLLAGQDYRFPILYHVARAATRRLTE